MRSLSYLTSVAACLVAVVASPTPKPGESPAVSPRQASSFWYSNIDHTTGNVRGFAPDLDGDWVYEVYKAVRPGDGAGIQAAINSGTNGASRHGQWFASQPRVCNSCSWFGWKEKAADIEQVVYIPPGEYLISKTIQMNTDTILMGDATNVSTPSTIFTTTHSPQNSLRS